MTAAPIPQSTEKQILAALRPEYLTPAQIAAIVMPAWASRGDGQAINTVQSVLDQAAMGGKVLVGSVAGQVAYAWKNPQADGAESLQRFYKEQQDEREARDAERKSRAAELSVVRDFRHGVAKIVEKNAQSDARPELPISAEHDAAALTPDGTDTRPEIIDMAKSAAAPPKKRGKNPKSFRTMFKGVSMGAMVTRVGVEFDRDILQLEEADKYFAEQRLTGRIIKMPADVDPKQKSFLENDYPTISGTFDVKGYRVGSSTIRCGLTFNTADLDPRGVFAFNKSEGRVEIDLAQGIPDDEKAGDDEDEPEDEEADEAE